MPQVVKLKKDELEILSPFLCLKEDGFLLSDKNIERHLLNRYFLYEFKKEDTVFAAKEKGSVLGYAALREAKWDSGHFGFKMGCLRIKSAAAGEENRKISSELIQEVINTASEKKFRHLCVKINPFQTEEIQALEKNGFYFTACLVSYILDLKHFNSAAESGGAVRITDFENQDKTALKKISLASFSDGNIWRDRFHADYGLDKKKSDDLYVKWTVNCCLKKEADIVLCAKLKQKPVGFITAKYDGEIKKWFGIKVAGVPLNAVNEKYRSRGIYKALVCELLSVLKKEKTDYAIITTQLNTKAVAKVWMGLGAKVDSSKMVLHKMLDGNL